MLESHHPRKGHSFCFEERHEQPGQADFLSPPKFAFQAAAAHDGLVRSSLPATPLNFFPGPCVAPFPGTLLFSPLGVAERPEMSFSAMAAAAHHRDSRREDGKD